MAEGRSNMVRKSRKKRLEEQRVRQLEHRANAKAEKRAGRDDMARVLLWLKIREAQNQKNPRRALDDLSDVIVSELERQGFDVKLAENAFDAIAAKYASGISPFRPKRHLQKVADTDPSSGSSS